jgi:hypothetical protein
MSKTLRKGSTCPACNKAKLAPIIYGLPGSELAALEELHEIVLGGCVVTGNDPELECPECTAQFMRDSERRNHNLQLE